ncbi:hypothetical protein CEE36_08695 [candidate division TA06 bacterium B3_TA06]|uniref:Zinc-ribbon domain-containing protein n=1 Tax=candidate division TA06 bacterium B3_TA06 TaxID=2012487 RepID=A0A532V150_UNCT6|nr:MAG: hypothetical protein CEE36_08695 [candidate division TA06 bacterium B3_TA06]
MANYSAGQVKHRVLPCTILVGVLLSVAGLFGTVKVRLTEEEIQREEEKLRELLVDKTIYDVDVKLEEVEAGYNIVVANRADVDSLRSFVDPTMVALIIGAWHTRGTNWKSDTLKVWIRPTEGWGVLTRDCRIAEGEAATEWFFLRTVDPYEFRKQLVPKFFRLKPPRGARGLPSGFWPVILGSVAFLALCAVALLLLLWKGVIRFPKTEAPPKPEGKKKPKTEDSKKEEPEAKFCPECGTSLKPTARFCPKCGERIEA